MVPPEFGTFFVTCALAAASLVGLLFVAVSVAPEDTIMEGAPVDRQAVAATAWTAFINVFFIALGAQIPHTNVGGFVVLFGGIGLLSTAVLLRIVPRGDPDWQTLVRRLVLLAISTAIYVAEIWQGALLFQSPLRVGPLYAVQGLLMAVFGNGLVRAWQLLGVRRYGIFSWLNPLHDQKPSQSISQSDQRPAGNEIRSGGGAPKG
jgi:hypothetical protein